MRDRIRQLIDYAANGNSSKFADMMGWSRQYLNKVKHDGAVGLSPIKVILQKLPEVDARWLLFGEGKMINDRENDILVRGILEFASRIRISQYIPVMSREEIAELEDGRLDWDDDVILRWSEEKKMRDREMEKRINDAKKRAIHKCK